MKRCSDTYGLRHVREFGIWHPPRSRIVCAGRTQSKTRDTKGTVKIVIGRAKFVLILLLLNASLLSVSRNSNATTDSIVSSTQSS